MKYEKILNDTWEFLENNYKGSEITLELWAKLIEEKSDTKNCLKQCIKLLWSQWEFLDLDYYNYAKKYIKNKYGVIVK